MAFSYSPLRSDEIRLIKPLSRASEPLSFEIVHVSLFSKPDYVALSYTWGPRDNRHQISLSGRSLSIRKNLNDALQQIQSSKLVHKYLWLDAICINQGTDEDALEERSIQITLMKQIYEQAAKVLVWLGKPVNETNNRLAFPMMRYFRKLHNAGLKKARPYRPWWWPHKSRTHGEDVADFLRTIEARNDKRIFDVPGSQTHRGWLGIIALWKSPWWTRTWVFQEATIPEPYKTVYITGVAVLPIQSKVIFLCGDQQADWGDLSVSYMVAASLLSTPGLETDILVGATNEAAKLMSFRARRIQEVPSSFLDILELFRHTKCADPRDKVYAPMYLAPEDVRDYIRPNYASQTVLDVYVDVVRYCLGQAGDELEFLGHVLYSEAAQLVQTPQGVKSTLPSWVPNFSANTRLFPIPKYLCVPAKVAGRAVTLIDRRALPNHNLSRIPAYRPLGWETRSPKRPLIQGNHTLLISGVYVDVLKDIIPNTGPDLEAIRTFARTRSRKWAMDMKFEYRPTGEGYSDAWNRMAALDVVYDELGRPSERGCKLDHAFMRKPRAELSLTEYRYQMNMREARDRASAQRNIGLSQGDYLLMIPNTAVVGDTIWALTGGKVLYILRPVVENVDHGAAHQYRIIGECYAHGLMDGEISRRVHTGEMKFQDISII